LSFFATTGLTIFVLILFLGVFLNLFGLPGTVIIFLDVLLYSLFTGFEHVGLKIIFVLLVLSALAESVEFFWVASEPHLLSANSKGSVTVIALGALAGAVLLTPVFWGPGMWTGFLLGGLAAALTDQIIRQFRLKAPYRAINSVIFNTIGKNIAKGFIALCMIAVSLSRIYS
jgi:hypothetical protein